MYLCPNCHRPIPADRVEEPAGDDHPMAFHDVEFICPSCGKRLAAKAVHTDDGEALELGFPGGVAPCLPGPDQAVLDAFFSKPPHELVNDGETVCEVCRRRLGPGRSALELMRSGWRVIQEFPGLRATCPQCYGG